ncbi:MAG: decarboxylating 6-phosphogluconate dehydrogenase [Candidatus Vogelbacteria bacterium]|nr:decarboxylating 6-phosphogluconate dehydrogenase [Candidatus Vogelbacteria bacterium]
MQIGYIGLGKMGHNMVLRLQEKGYEVVATDKNTESVKAVANVVGIKGTANIVDLVASLAAPRLVWVMVPNAAVGSVFSELLPLLQGGDMVIDGGNSFFKDSMRRAKDAADKGVEYLDIGVSGGVLAARNGACMMIGGAHEVFERHENLFRDLALPNGYGYMGPSGAGHFVKMVHNGIEYGMMQAIAEGMEVLKRAPFSVDLNTVASVYNHGSIVESRLIGWLGDAFRSFGVELEGVSGSVAHTGEGQWTVETARELGVPVPVIEESFNFRLRSAERPSFTGRVISALRNMFGGHSIQG